MQADNIAKASLDDVAKTAFDLQIASDPCAEGVGWNFCEQAAKTIGFTIDDDNEDDLEDAVYRLWDKHTDSPAPLGKSQKYDKGGQNGIPGWFAISDNHGYYMDIQFERRLDADVFCFWKTEAIEEGQGSYCPALIEPDLSTRCDI